MKSNDKQQSNHTNTDLKNSLLKDKTVLSKIEEKSTQIDGFRYDYDDSSDL